MRGAIGEKRPFSCKNLKIAGKAYLSLKSVEVFFIHKAALILL
jgi:hypothetical protein